MGKLPDEKAGKKSACDRAEAERPDLEAWIIDGGGGMMLTRRALVCSPRTIRTWLSQWCSTIIRARFHPMSSGIGRRVSL
jgi:hypothetical protein